MLEMVGEMKAEKHTPEYMKETKMERKWSWFEMKENTDLDKMHCVR